MTGCLSCHWCSEAHKGEDLSTVHTCRIPVHAGLGLHLHEIDGRYRLFEFKTQPVKAH